MELTQQRISTLAAASLLLAVCLIRIPVPDGQGRALMRFIAEIALCLIFAGVIWEKVNPWAGAFVALACFSWVLAVFRYSDPDINKAVLLSRDAVLFGAGALLFFKISGVNSQVILDAMIVAGIVNLVFLAFQTVGVDPFSVFTLGLMKSSWAHPTGLMSNKNETSCLFALVAFACIRENRVKFLIFMVAGLVLARSTGGVMAFTAGMIFLLAAHGVRLRVLLGWSSLLFFLFVILFDSEVSIAFTERARIWHLADSWLVEHPLLGIGPGLWSTATTQLHAHNEFLQAWLEFGYLAPVIFVGYAVSVWRRWALKAAVPVAAMLAAAVNCAVSFPMHIAPTALIILAWVGISEGCLNEST